MFKEINKIQIANILLTRRCNLNCEYCNIVKKYVGRPEEYKDLDFLRHNECNKDQWIQTFDRIYQNNPGVFFILYGGEPFMHPEIYDIVKYLKDNGYQHTIISNNTPMIRERIKKLYEYIGTIPGFTASIDPELCLYLDHQNVRDDDAVKKTIAGFEYLKFLKENNYADDVVAEITVSSENIDYLYRTIEILSENGIYSSITTIDDQKSKYYDFSNISKGNRLMVQPDVKTRLIFDKIQQNHKLLVHMPELLDELYNNLPANYQCQIYKNIHNVTIDSDMTFRLCLRIQGTEVSKIKVCDAIDESGNFKPEFIKAMEKDYVVYCKGCNWTCTLMSNFFSDHIITH